ncbi:MAG: pyridoxamine 5'-phosphate oxidase [Alphaproteobacteria bacterium]|nr:pyridoxamine 5'-phosphate oxidase [Alphaproteobacteria bacterium]
MASENINFTPPADPWALFREWYALAETSEAEDPNAMALATAGRDGVPSVRMVLLRGYDARGLVFFSNRQSRKGQQLSENAKAAICLYWKSLDRQIRVEGSVVPISDAESDAYFAARPRGSQIGAWASAQSQPLASRAALETRVKEIEKQYEGKPVQRPPYWGGYRLAPLRMEFWQEREFRLHDRIAYYRKGDQDSWTMERLYP